MKKILLNTILVFFIPLLFEYCNAKRTIVYSESEMEGTIPIGTKLNLSKFDSISVGQIVAFKMPKSDAIKVLRVVGLPNDKIEIINGTIYRNEQQYNLPSSTKKEYVVFCKNPSNFELITHYNFMVYSENYSFFSLTNKEYNELIKLKVADSIYRLNANPKEISTEVISTTSSKYSNRYYFGPIKIPPKNSIIDEDILRLTTLANTNRGKILDEEYFFCIGDNFPEAKDSRYIGLIPKRNILGIVSK